ncbi:hypothetical protein E2C01_086098 [Portunus trituberculatus]|uniref:Uncharacterized protein n=1 Tax=Portunus trituberculatus TaxID=210409 RepID=A0A5B7J9C9_PORTR|nr:hypothetical protein [Portunus trituberculatus]
MCGQLDWLWPSLVVRMLCQAAYPSHTSEAWVTVVTLAYMAPQKHPMLTTPC